MKRLLLSLGLIAAIAVPAFASPLKTPTPAPAWSLTDLNGNPIKSEQFKGKVLVVDFWATWCAPCVGELPGYVKLQQKYADKGVVFVGISIDSIKADKVKAFAEKHGITYPVAIADDHVFQDFGGNETIPFTIIVDRNGNVRDRTTGAISEADFEKELLKYL